MTENELEDPLIAPLVKALTRAPTLMGVPVHVLHVQRRGFDVCFLISHNLFLLVGGDPACTCLASS